MKFSYVQAREFPFESGVSNALADYFLFAQKRGLARQYAKEAEKSAKLAGLMALWLDLWHLRKCEGQKGASNWSGSLPVVWQNDEAEKLFRSFRLICELNDEATRYRASFTEHARQLPDDVRETLLRVISCFEQRS